MLQKCKYVELGIKFDSKNNKNKINKKNYNPISNIKREKKSIDDEFTHNISERHYYTKDINNMNRNIILKNPAQFQKNNKTKKADFRLIKKSNVNIFYIIILILILVNISLAKKHIFVKKLNSLEEIIITVYGPKTARIFSTELRNHPDEIYINGYKVTFNSTYTFYFESGINICRVIYNTPPTTLEKMFKSVNQISKVDFSNFDASNVNSMYMMFQNCQYLENVIMTGVTASLVTNMESMFENCQNIKSLDLSSFQTSSATNMKKMFYNCDKLEYLDISNFVTTSVSDMTQMFCNCKVIEYIDISSFSTSNTIMSQMFKYCVKLQSIKFPDTNTLSVSNMASLFQDCRVLTSLDLSSFDTSGCTTMAYMFDNCYELITLDLSNFETSSVKSFLNMFSYCKKLESLDLSNFDTTSVTDMQKMIQYCGKLIYLNLISFTTNDNMYINDMLKDLKGFTKLCYDEEKAPLIKTKYESLINDCTDNCFEGKKLISELNKCVDDCREDNTYQYEYNNKCYSTCPKGTIPNEQYLCENLVCNYYNMDKTECFDEIPIGYYVYNPQQKILDICHDSCITCYKKGEGGNTNCLTCKNDYFLYNGNCFENCEYGDYTEDSIKKCTCLSNMKCKICPDESLNSNLCISCNEGYYPKYVENPNPYSFIDCYNTLEQYYLKDQYFYPCYSSCLKCSDPGDSDNHNCDECLPNYKIINELNQPKNCYKECDYYYYIENNEYKCTETNSCNNQQKLIRDKSKCIDNCIDDDIYRLEYNNECVQTCPEDTQEENNKCIERIEETTQVDNSESYTIEITDQGTTQNIQSTILTQTSLITLSTIVTQSTIITQSTILTQSSIVALQTTIVNLKATENSMTSEEWSAEDFFLGKYSSENTTLNKDDIIKNIREDIINHNLDPLISNVIKEKEDVYIKEDNTLFQITTSENQKKNNYTNISTINLGDCERILKEKYDVKDNETLIILKIDYNKTGLLIPIIGYEVYHPRNKSKLDLSYCEESSINYNIPVSIDEDSLYKYNPNSEYYNDECSTYTTENGTDILLNDRKEEFSDNNLSLCENICGYVGYDLETKKALCECGIKYEEFLLSEVDNKTDLLANNFTTDNSTSNAGAMKCYDVLFSKDGLLTNIGSYLLLFIFTFHVISIIIFYKCGYHFISSNIEEIIKEKKTLKKIKKKEREKSRKTSIYNLEKNRKIRKLSSHKLIPKNNKNRIKKYKSFGNPTKKWKRKSSKIVIQENTNISNNQKSITKLTLKQTKIIPHFARKRSISLKSKKEGNKKIGEYNPKSINILFYNDFELNTLDYEDALKIDKRSSLQYYVSLLITKHYIFFPFCQKKDFNVFIIKICLMFLFFAVYYVFNTIFFDFTAIHKIYVDGGNYNLSFFFPLIIYSFIISYHINILIKYFTLSERNLIEIKKEKTIELAKAKKSKVERCIIIKNICYFVISIIFLLFFWYYLSSFGAVYKNSQIYLIENTFISFLLGLIYPFLINILPVFFRKFSLSANNRECIYKTSKILQLL